MNKEKSDGMYYNPFILFPLATPLISLIFYAMD